MKRIVPLILTVVFLVSGCTGTPDVQSVPVPVEPTAQTAELPLDLQNAGDNTSIDPHSVEPTPKASEDEQPGARNSAPTAPNVEPTPEKPKDESTRTQSTLNPEATVKPTSKPQRTPSATQPSATLEIVLPPLEPEPTPKPTAKPTEKPTEKPTQTPEPPQPTEAPTTPPEEPPAQPEKTEPPAAGYMDATYLCASFMDAINTEKAANGAVSGSLDSGLCSIAQDRARQMAEACKASHIGSGYPETVGAMGSENGVTNRGRNSVHHSPQLMDCTSFGVGVAIGSDGMYYYSIIGE